MRAIVVDVVAQSGLLTTLAERGSQLCQGPEPGEKRSKNFKQRKNVKQRRKQNKELLQKLCVHNKNSSFRGKCFIAMCVFQMFLGLFCGFSVKGIETLIMARDSLSPYGHNQQERLGYALIFSQVRKNKKKHASKYPKQIRCTTPNRSNVSHFDVAIVILEVPARHVADPLGLREVKLSMSMRLKVRFDSPHELLTPAHAPVRSAGTPSPDIPVFNLDGLISIQIKLHGLLRLLLHPCGWRRRGR